MASNAAQAAYLRGTVRWLRMRLQGLREEASRVARLVDETQAAIRQHEADADRLEGRPKLHPELDAIVNPVMDND